MALNKIIVVKETNNKISVGLPIQQETLDSVTDRGNTTNNSITVNGLTVAGHGSGTAKIGDLYGSQSYTGISFNNSNTSSGYNLLSSPSDQHLYINRPSGYNIRFKEGDGEPDQMTISSSGNVGIGTTNPSARLAVAGHGTGQALIGDLLGTTNYTGISLNSTSSATTWNLTSSPTDQHLYINRPTGKFITFLESGSYPHQLIIDTGGKVGINIPNGSSPSAKLDVNGEAIIRGPFEVTRTDDNIRVIYRSYNGKNPEQHFLIHDVQDWVIGQDGSDNKFKIASADSTPAFASSSVRLSIDTSGRVGIGTSTPSAKLNVSGDVRLDGQDTTAPSNTSTPVAWFSININGTSYKMPLYQ